MRRLKRTLAGKRSIWEEITLSQNEVNTIWEKAIAPPFKAYAHTKAISTELQFKLPAGNFWNTIREVCSSQGK